jgi:uncharacterized membrane protein
MENGVEVRQLFLVNLPKDEVYASWRRIGDFPKFMKSVRSVEEIDAKHSRWTIEGPGGRRVTWEAEIVDEEPGRVLAWRTVGDADVRHGGRVEFFEATGNRGTVVAARMSYESPVGNLAPALAKLFGEDPETQVREDLRRFKQLIETGEIPTVVGQSTGRDAKEERDVEQSEKAAKPARTGRRADARGEATP